MRFLARMEKELLYGGLSRSEFLQVEEPVRERNRKNLSDWLISTSIFWIMSLILSLKTDAYAACRTVYLGSLMLNVLIYLGAFFLARRFPRFIYVFIYLFELSQLGTGVAISLFQPDVRTVTLIVMAVVVPPAFIDRSIASVLLLLLANLGYGILGKQVICGEVFSWEALNLFIFSLVGLLTGQVINKDRFERYLFSDSAKKLADMRLSYNAQLRREIEAKTARIVAMQDQFVLGMATLVEKRDSSTGGHVVRTSMGVRILSEAMREDPSLQVPEGFYDKVIKAAPMHDLGKITVDDAILRKPGRYTPGEYAVMQTHAAEGARIVRELLSGTDDPEFRSIAENVAHYHHEHVDGHGYPDGLKGEEIPLEARIMAIADVYDALVSRRVYKEPYSFEKADRIILEGMGSHFDPGLRPYYEAARPKLQEYYARELGGNA